MDYVRLGGSGLKVSKLCLGCMSYRTDKLTGFHHDGWTLGEAESMAAIARAVELGINFFDTADVYSFGESEVLLGRAIRAFARREEMVVATKLNAPMGPGPNARGLSRKHVMESIDASLKRLNMDYVDLYQTHRWDYETPIEETMEALHDVVRAGKALYIGASSMHAWQLAVAQHAADLNGWTRFVSMQPQYNLIYREEEREMLPFCRDQGVGVIPWSPLARGFLANPRQRDADGASRRARSDGWAADHYGADDFEVADRLVEVAAARGVPPMQIALAWVASRPGVTAPIIGATRISQLEESVAALDITLADEEVTLLEERYRPHPVRDLR